MLKRRRRGHIQLRGNGTFLVHVYAGRDPITASPPTGVPTAADAASAGTATTTTFHP